MKNVVGQLYTVQMRIDISEFQAWIDCWNAVVENFGRSGKWKCIFPSRHSVVPWNHQSDVAANRRHLPVNDF